VAEWSGRALQKLVRRFDSGPCLQVSQAVIPAQAGIRTVTITIIAFNAHFNHTSPRLPGDDGLSFSPTFYLDTLAGSCFYNALFDAFPDSSAVEQSTVNRLVVGSNPTQGAILYPHPNQLLFRMRAYARGGSNLAQGASIHPQYALRLGKPPSSSF
jgi:hypothetical protein